MTIGNILRAMALLAERFGRECRTLHNRIDALEQRIVALEQKPQQPPW